MTDQRKVALVTGGARRVGRAIVERLADAGMDVAFTWHASESAARSLKDALERAGRRALALQADLTQPEEAIESIGAAVESAFGRLDVLVNNASIYEPATLEQSTLEASRRLWAIHLESPMLLCRRFAPALRSSAGSVVNMVDLLAERPWPRYLAYCASKAGLWNLTLGLARELAPAVTVNAIAPGVVQWPDGFPEADRQKYLSRVLLARAGTPEDVAETVYFLCTAGRYITGQVIRLDGGRSVT